MTNFRGDQALARLLEYADIKTIIDVGSGTGQHAKAMRDAGKDVTAISLIEPADWLGDFMKWPLAKTDFDAIWACHVLEHQVDPGAFLRECRRRLRPDGYLFVTVPPLKPEIVGGHVTLWNAGLLLYQLILAGFDCRTARVGTYGYNISVIVQNKPITLPLLHRDNGDIDRLAQFFPLPVQEAFDGRIKNVQWESIDRRTGPEHVVILGLGPSLEAYVDKVKRLGSRQAFADEVWGINAVGDVIQCDKIFHLDDVRVQEARANAAPQSNIANMVAWLKQHPGPIYTSRLVEGYPGLVEYPLEAVINGTGFAYFNGTAAYVAAYAIHLGVKRISFFGCDYTYASSHFAERGRACLEFWIGMAVAKGIEICVPDKSSLLDACEPDNSFYGYDGSIVKLEKRDDGLMQVSFEPKELPSAEEIEKRYDHSQHPSTLMSAK